MNHYMLYSKTVNHRIVMGLILFAFCIAGCNKEGAEEKEQVKHSEEHEAVSWLLQTPLPSTVQNIKYWHKGFMTMNTSYAYFELPYNDLVSLLNNSPNSPKFSEFKSDADSVPAMHTIENRYRSALVGSIYTEETIVCHKGETACLANRHVYCEKV